MSDSGIGGAHPEYVLGHVVQALSEDPRVSEMDIGVTVDADCVVLEGCVTTSEHRTQIEAVVRELVPERRLRNLIAVRRFSPPGHVEWIGDEGGAATA